MFSPGQKVCIEVEGRTVTFTIDRPFVPFAKSVVLLARSPQLAPDPVVVKIYDPRFIYNRIGHGSRYPARPWSLEIEKAAAAIWHDPFNMMDLWKGAGEPQDDESLAARSAIPRLLLTGTFLPPDERVFQPFAPVFEYIPDTVSLCNVSGDVLEPEVCAALVRAVDSFSLHGVYHTDLHWNNILFTPSDRPTRAVVIDFECAILRGPDEDDEA